MERKFPGLRIPGDEPVAAAAAASTSVESTARSAPPSAMQQQQQEYLFELAPLGPGDLLSRCREGPGNWWGEGNEDLRVDAKGRVVLVDPEMYYEHHYAQRNYIGIAVSVLWSVLSGRSLGKPSALTPQLVEHLSKVWHRPRRPLSGVILGGGGGERTLALAEGVVAVALGRRVAAIPLRPWGEYSAVMAPRLEQPSQGRKSDGLNLHGQVLAWSEDGSVLAVSTPTGGVECLRYPSGACLANVAPRSSSAAAKAVAGGLGGNSAAHPGAGIAGVALRGSTSSTPAQGHGGKMEVLVLTFDAVLALYSFPVVEGLPRPAREGDDYLVSPVCEQRLGRWHASTCAMAFHAATDTVAVAGPSGASRPSSSLSLTLWRVSGGVSSPSSDDDESVSGASSGTGGGVAGSARSRTRGGGGGGGGRGLDGAAGTVGGAVSPPRLSELHSVTLEGGSLVVPAPRAGLDRAPAGTVPALLPLFFPGLRAVAPPVEVTFNPSGTRLAVLDIAGGVSVVETSENAANASVLGRRCLSADGRSWRRDTGDTSPASPPPAAPVEGRPPLSMEGPAAAAAATVAGAGAGAEAGRGNSGAGVPRAVSIGWWSESTVAALSSTGDLAFLDARPPHPSPRPAGTGTAATAATAVAAATAAEITASFQGFDDGGAGTDESSPAGRGWARTGAVGAPRPPPLGPRCTVWFAGDGRRAAVCWPGAG
ncbi:unnamed protein product, partial [Pylaiella littoralis]